MTDEIVPVSEILGDQNGSDASFHKIILYPLRVINPRFLADLVDFEPFSFSLVEFVASNGTTRSHISQHGTNVVRPLVDRSATNKGTIVKSTYRAITGSPPVESDVITWICISNESSWTRIGTTRECRVVGTLIRILFAD